MANLGKFIAAAGGAIIAVFSLIGMICVLAADKYAISSGDKVNVVFQGIIMIALGGGAAALALMMFDSMKCVVAALAIVAAILSSTLVPNVLMLGGMGFYVILGAMVTIVGVKWECCSKAACKPGDAAVPPAGETKL